MNGSYADFLSTKHDDYQSILKEAAIVNKNINNDSTGGLKIALIGTCSTQYIASVLKAMLICNGIPAKIYEGQYNGLIMEVFDDTSGMYSFQPDIVILLPDYRDIRDVPSLFDDLDTVEQKVKEAVDNLTRLIEHVHERLNDAHILFSNIAAPFVSSLGNINANVSYSETGFYDRINLKLATTKPQYVTILDTERLSREIGKRNWFDDGLYYLSKLGFSLKYIGHFCDMVFRQIRAMKGGVKKCLVFDLDNTIWGGCVGEDGFDGINLDPNDAEGEAYQMFQTFLLSLKRRGVLLAVCSKNDENVAKEAFDKNLFMKLQMEDIACFICNWDDKASNIQRIADALNIGIDSIVFFDDNPTERELIRNTLSEVEVIDVSEDSVFYVRDLYSAHAFEWNEITKEDIGRTDTYVSDLKRDDLQIKFGDYREFLHNLLMKAQFLEINKAYVGRFTQLLNKTNQFNLMTNRYSEAMVSSMQKDKSFGMYAIQMEDRFSRYGIIACVILKFTDNVCEILDWCMSCRVLKKGVERFTIKKIVEAASQRRCDKIIGYYGKTVKNGMVSCLFEELGFHLLKEVNGKKEYELKLVDVEQLKWDNEIEEVHDEQG